MLFIAFLLQIKTFHPQLVVVSSELVLSDCFPQRVSMPLIQSVALSGDLFLILPVKSKQRTYSKIMCKNPPETYQIRNHLLTVDVPPKPVKSSTTVDMFIFVGGKLMDVLAVFQMAHDGPDHQYGNSLVANLHLGHDPWTKAEDCCSD
jgi:hypothetical protein